jgi:hypothetical protein
MYNKNKGGPKTDPCGTPYFTFLCDELQLVFTLPSVFLFLETGIYLTGKT